MKPAVGWGVDVGAVSGAAGDAVSVGFVSLVGGARVVGEAVAVAVASTAPVGVAMGVAMGVEVGVEVVRMTLMKVGVAVAVAVGELVAVVDGAGVVERVARGVGGVGVAEGLALRVAELTAVGVAVGAEVGVAEGGVVGVGLGTSVAVGVDVGPVVAVASVVEGQLVASMRVPCPGETGP